MLALAMPLEASGQAPPPQPGLIERTAPAPAPSLGPPLLPPEPQAATGPGAQREVPIGQVRVAGNTALPDATLRPAWAGLEARQVTLAEVEAARLAVLAAYRAAGFAYVAVGASLSAGEDGRADLLLTVTEGFVAEIALEGEIGPAAAQLRRFLDPLLALRPLPHAALERALLLAGDIPGVTARGLLRPVEGDPGALQLLVRLERAAVSGFASLDNRGNPATGAWQGLVVGQLNAFTSRGERTELALFQSDAFGQSFAQFSGEVFLGGSGLRLRGFAGVGRAAPGGALAALGYAGDTRVAGLSLAQPIIRSRPRNLTLTAQLDAFESVVQLRQGAGAPRERVSRDAVRALRLGVEGEVRDAILSFAPAAASSSASLRLHQGIEAFGASTGSHGTTSRLNSDFGFVRVVAEASRLQPLVQPAEGWVLSLFGAAAVQWADDALPPAEKFYLGGNRLGRGFYAGQLAGDRAMAGSLELQLATDIALPWSPDRRGLQFYVFRDEGRARDNSAGTETRRLASFGGGFRLQLSEGAQWEMEALRRLTRTPEGAGVRELDEGAVFTRVLLRF
ncbi:MULTISPECIES: ShlB/FhaC/HecB family hemolysin secretion/activation protein [Roseomonadaceae]|uniref:ShlB/FhaC/HecB family hemolysin secretion/activation protein n=1 Tax=Falsiroseomonas oleicola TaxID=2801474 RepID=A0ABS6H8C3_9PROT|nr:ShlB/FhaC/HecB family hemolysin secretion/activation protein [Roseomonas oleicola]MBU8544953.1 ShlB/FhaC/HecB family hemolysin secretion/activation protein [Roseomonas oleicola]